MDNTRAFENLERETLSKRLHDKAPSKDALAETFAEYWRKPLDGMTGADLWRLIQATELLYQTGLRQRG